MPHNQIAHNLSMIQGYIVEQTMQRGKRLPEPITRNRLEGASRYGDAIRLAKTYRKFSKNPKTPIKSWAVIRAVYSDGCISEPF